MFWSKRIIFSKFEKGSANPPQNYYIRKEWHTDQNILISLRDFNRGPILPSESITRNSGFTAQVRIDVHPRPQFSTRHEKDSYLKVRFPVYQMIMIMWCIWQYVNVEYDRLCSLARVKKVVVKLTGLWDLNDLSWSMPDGEDLKHEYEGTSMGEFDRSKALSTFHSSPRKVVSKTCNFPCFRVNHLVFENVQIFISQAIVSWAWHKCLPHAYWRRNRTRL